MPVRHHHQLFKSCLICALTLLVGVTGRAQPAEENDAWTLLSRFLYRDAAEIFERDAGGGRLRDLGLAAALLNDPPVIPSKITRAEGLLQGVVKESPTDDTGLYAQYLLARIMQVHRETPVKEVEAAYRKIITAAPESASAQLAAAQLALVILYQRSDLDVSGRLAQAADLAAVAGSDRLPDVASSYFHQLAEAALFYKVTDEQVLGWLEQAHAIGSSNPLYQSSFNLQLAEVARAIGQREKALTYYEQFLLTASSTDQRYYTAKARMDELKEETR